MEIAKYLTKEKFKKSGSVSFVNSIYLDNRRWKTYYDHKNREKHRFKVRIRQYGFNGEKCFGELKEKIHSVTFKNRFKIKKKWLDDFLDGKDILSKLIQCNREMAYYQLVRVYWKMKDKIESYQLEPVVQIKYQRESFRGRNEGVRVTFDRNFCFRGIKNNFVDPVKKSYICTANRVIMETKTDGPRPVWLKELISRHGLKKQRFSKYCTSIEGIYIPLENRKSEAEYAGFH